MSRGALTRWLSGPGAFDERTLRGVAWVSMVISAALLVIERIPTLPSIAWVLAAGVLGCASRIPAALVAALSLLIVTSPSASGLLWTMWLTAALFLLLVALQSTGRNATLALLVALCSVVVRVLIPVWELPAGVLVGGLSIMLGAAAQGTSIRLRRQIQVRARERDEILERNRQSEVTRIVSDERRRIARDLHDGIAHHVAVIGVHVSLARTKIATAPADAERALAAVQAEARAVLADLHDTLLLLRDESDDDGNTGPTGPAPGYDRANDLVRSFEQIGLTIHARLGPVRSLPPQEDLAAYRVIQEGLTNAHKHGTGRAELSAGVSGGNLLIAISNPVRPYGPPRHTGAQLGLIGLRERVRASGGAIGTITADDVYELRVTLPLHGRLVDGAEQ